MGWLVHGNPGVAASSGDVGQRGGRQSGGAMAGTGFVESWSSCVAILIVVEFVFGVGRVSG